MRQDFPLAGRMDWLVSILALYFCCSYNGQVLVWNTATWMPAATGFLQSGSSSNAMQPYHLSTAYKTGDVWAFSFNWLFI
jgi:hypothetical protein